MTRDVSGAGLKQYGADLSVRGSRGAQSPDPDTLSADQLNQHFAGVGARVAAEAMQTAQGMGTPAAGPRPPRVCASAFAPNA